MATAAVNAVDTEEDSNWILAEHKAGKGNSRVSKPFKCKVELIDGEKKVKLVEELVNSGAMIAGISKQLYERIRDSIGGWGESTMWMRMADGAQVLGIASWQGMVRVKGVEVDRELEVFDSGGQWKVLFRKPLLERFRVVNDFGKDRLAIRQGKEAVKMFNKGLGKKVDMRKKKLMAATVDEVDNKEND
ncbi:hypothetical protein V5O48_017673, partial [Marasmius crinis-equi]